ncbi:MAG: hypothetical protein RIM99_06085 [Cyclobacteriaceae bacterium]
MIIRDHSQLSDSEFEKKFKEITLKPGLFSHEAHIRLAYIHINKYGLEKAEQNMCKQISAFAAFHGGTGFNTTVTIAATKAVNHFMGKAKTENFYDFIQEFPRLITNFKDLLRQHYGFNVFADEKAKKEFVEPDLAPF